MGTVRGYTLAEIGGDMGYSASIDYTIPFPKTWKLSPGPLFKDWPPLSQTLSLNMFADYGRMFTLDKLPSETTDEDIAGTGFGFTLNIPKKRTSILGSVLPWPMLSRCLVPQEAEAPTLHPITHGEWCI